MEEGARDMRLVSHPHEGAEPDHRRPADPGLSANDLDAARDLAEFHRNLAAELPPHSQVRGLVLRCAGHWSRLGAIPRNGLTGVEHPDGD
jgi:hypothetical protein